MSWNRSLGKFLGGVGGSIVGGIEGIVTGAAEAIKEAKEGASILEVYKTFDSIMHEKQINGMLKGMEYGEENLQEFAEGLTSIGINIAASEGIKTLTKPSNKDNRNEKHLPENRFRSYVFNKKSA